MSAPIPADAFVAALTRHGTDRATGVPCGHLAGPWQLLEERGMLTPAVSEGAALAIAAGWELGGAQPAVMCQNSGFGNMVNPLTSLIIPYRIPVLVVMTLRGWPDPAQDEPQHAVMGAATTALLDALSVPYAILQADRLEQQLRQADRAREQAQPFFLLVPRGTIEGPRQDAPLSARHVPGDDSLTRPAVVAELMRMLTSEALITTTGYISRQAFFETDRDGTFYMQGSMGHAAAIGLGLATSPAARPVVVLDGDGAFLMHMGTGSTIGANRPDNLIHIVVDNHCYESTGCQRSTSSSVRWDLLGHGLGYRTVLSGNARSNLPKLLAEAMRAPGPVLCTLEVEPTPDDVHPRATSATSPQQITTRFRAAAAKAFLDGGSRA